MTREEHLLECLTEECAEVIQRVTKAQRFGITEAQRDQPLDNRDRLTLEVIDLLAIIDMCAEAGLLNLPPIPTLSIGKSNKRSKVERYLEYSRLHGRLS